MNDPSPGDSESSRSRFTRFAILVLLLAALAAPFVVRGALGALNSTSNDPRQWLPQDFAETDLYDWFHERFGSDEIAVVSWPGCDLQDPRVGELSDALSQSPYFSRVRSGPSVLT